MGSDQKITRRTNNRIRTCLFCLFGALLVLQTGCGATMQEPEQVIDNGFIPATPGNYDSADTAVVVKIDADNSTITLLNLEIGRQYTLNYDGTSQISDKFGEVLAMSQVSEGDIVDVRFMKTRKRLTSLQQSTTAFSYTDAGKYLIDSETGSLTIGDDVLKLSENLLILSDGTLIDEMDLNAMDVLNIYGIDRTVYSLVVSKGHGYVSFLNDENFIGGWVEIGTTIVPIRQGMLLTIPEGTYDISVSKQGTNAALPVTVMRNEETEVDLGGIEMVEASRGSNLFNVTPATARVYIDGVETDVSDPISLTTGIHQVIISADGYISLTQYIKVGTVTTSFDFVLEAVESSDEEDEDTEDSESDTDAQTSTDANSSSGTGSDGSSGTATESTSSGGTTGATTGYIVYIDAPEDVEVYKDGTYLGIAPLSFEKQEGTYVITLRKAGYQTRSYTISVDATEKDISYSFDNLRIL